MDLPIEIRTAIQDLDSRIKQHSDQGASISLRLQSEEVTKIDDAIIELEQVSKVVGL